VKLTEDQLYDPPLSNAIKALNREMLKQWDGKVCVRTKSHRCRERLEQAIGTTRTYHSFHFDGCFHMLTPEQWSRVKTIKGLGKTRVDLSMLSEHW
jgi:hypothetical protein